MPRLEARQQLAHAPVMGSDATTTTRAPRSQCVSWYCDSSNTLLPLGWLDAKLHVYPALLPGGSHRLNCAPVWVSQGTTGAALCTDRLNGASACASQGMAREALCTNRRALRAAGFRIRRAAPVQALWAGCCKSPSPSRASFWLLAVTRFSSKRKSFPGAFPAQNSCASHPRPVGQVSDCWGPPVLQQCQSFADAIKGVCPAKLLASCQTLACHHVGGWMGRCARGSNQRACVCARTRACMCACACVHVCVCVSAHVSMYSCARACMCVHV